jgi:hypothetical protein
MKKLTYTALAFLPFFLTSCGGGDESAEVAAKYTEETAKAIIEGSWHIAGSVLLAGLIAGIRS